MTERFNKFFGKDFDEAARKKSFDFIEDFISQFSDKAWNTDNHVKEFEGVIKKLDKGDFALLLSHTGYIPEFYEHDSSQETLYSKLIEVLVCEWAIRIGFKDSTIQKQKSSKEDVTIRIGNVIVVCDTKSYRLGRSQAAPNVKDIIKKADYEKWQQNWLNQNTKDITFKTIGGLIPFPSMHRWKGASDAYLYSTDSQKPIAIIFYEYIAYFYLKDYSHENIIKMFSDYAELFPEPSTDQHQYFEKITEKLFGDDKDGFFEYVKLFAEISAEKVKHTIERIQNELKTIRKVVEDDISKKQDIPELRAMLIEALVANQTDQLSKNLENIDKFRTKPIEVKATRASKNPKKKT